MGIAGITPTGGAPKPDPERVATIRYTIIDEHETCATFGENARATLASLNDRALAETRNGDLGESSLLLDHVRDRVAGLDPARLEPRGLFDSRSRRLKAFRAAYASAAAAATQSAADIGDRASALARKSTTLETLWSETRDAIAELDAHIAAARSWLANEPPAAVVEPVAEAGPEPVEDALEPVEAPQALAEPEAESVSASEPEPEPAPEPTPVATLPHPLQARLAALEAVRGTAIGRLPLLRAAQNADCRAPAALKKICDGIEAWRADWQDALGLAGKKPRTVTPDRARLTTATSVLTDRIDATARELSAAQGRRAELEARTAPAPATAALAA